MKKKYEKPIFVFEDFSLNTTIAGDCGIKTNTPSSGDCAYNIESVTGETWAVFTDKLTICTTKEANLDGVADGIFNGICYHVPTETSNLFNS